MNRDDIIRMARDSSNTPHDANTTPDLFGENQIIKFFQVAYAAGAAHEREACAKVCEELGEKGYVAEGCAAAIRARGEQKMSNLTPEQLAFRAGYEQGRFDANVETALAEQDVQYTGNGTAGREADVKPTGFFFQMPEQTAQPSKP